MTTSTAGLAADLIADCGTVKGDVRRRDPSSDTDTSFRHRRGSTPLPGKRDANAEHGAHADRASTRRLRPLWSSPSPRRRNRVTRERAQRVWTVTGHHGDA
jgi:hypothetical protein